MVTPDTSGAPGTPASTPVPAPPARYVSRVTALSRRRWWSYVAACALLGIFAVVWPLASRWRAYGRAHPVQPLHVARGQEGQYADARWRLLDTIVDPPAPAGAPGVRVLPPGSSLVRARFTVIPGSATDLQALQRCRTQVRDRAGRRWDASGGRFNKLPNNCGSGTGPDYKTITATVGQPWTFEVGFVVPDDVVREVEPELLLNKQFPQYLHFSR